MFILLVMMTNCGSLAHQWRRVGRMASAAILLTPLRSTISDWRSDYLLGNSDFSHLTFQVLALSHCWQWPNGETDCQQNLRASPLRRRLLSIVLLWTLIALVQISAQIILNIIIGQDIRSIIWLLVVRYRNSCSTPWFRFHRFSTTWISITVILRWLGVDLILETQEVRQNFFSF